MELLRITRRHNSRRTETRQGQTGKQGVGTCPLSQHGRGCPRSPVTQPGDSGLLILQLKQEKKAGKFPRCFTGATLRKPARVAKGPGFLNSPLVAVVSVNGHSLTRARAPITDTLHGKDKSLTLFCLSQRQSRSYVHGHEVPCCPRSLHSRNKR